METWDINEVGVWLTNIGEGPSEYSSEFVKQYIDGCTLSYLSDSDLRDHLGVREFGIRKQILREIKKELSTTSSDVVVEKTTLDCIPVSSVKHSKPFQLSSQHITQLTVEGASTLINKTYIQSHKAL